MGGPNEYKVRFFFFLFFSIVKKNFFFSLFSGFSEKREKNSLFFSFFLLFFLPSLSSSLSFFFSHPLSRFLLFLSSSLTLSLASLFLSQGRNMVDAHIGLVDLRYPEDFLIVAKALAAVLAELNVPKQETDDVMALVGTLEPDFKKIARFRKMMEEDTE